MTRYIGKIKKIFLLASLFVFSLPSLIASAQAQLPVETISYYYDSILVNIKVNEDSTIDIEERQTFNYTGEFHTGWRNIPLTKVDAITDISVVDGQTGKTLEYSRSRLDKLDPSSWGKFTSFRDSGDQNIEWYYNLKNTTHSWILKYKVHGSIEFLKDKDRLYWNIFSFYDVPVNFADASVGLPKKFSENEVAYTSYVSSDINLIQNSFNPATGEFRFVSLSQNFGPGEAFTIDITWPKGAVSQSAYWRDFFFIYYGIILSVLVVIIGFLAGLIWWLKTEKSQKGRPTIVAQYEPPEHIKPAMAEIITKEKLTNKGLTATIIDLAVRGYVRIEEDKSLNAGWRVFVSVIAPVFYFVVIGLITIPHFFFGDLDAPILVFSAILILVIFSFISRAKNMFKNYTILKNKEYFNDPSLEDYEKEYLDILFRNGEYFSTREMKKASPSRQQEFHKLTLKLKDSIYKETELDTRAFDVGLMAEKKKIGIWVLIFFVASFVIGYLNKFLNLDNQSWIFLVVTVATGAALWAFIKYEARLSEHGRILKDDWLGFKLYLETAEKYRMQNLTPDLFEKYLPYAMIFGIEKKWAKSFEAMHLAPPNWYGSAGVYGASSSFGGSSGSGSFSPTGFSSSFTSAFSSAFASSGASGGGGGGGGAGGGGGGGGGGAS